MIVYKISMMVKRFVYSFSWVLKLCVTLLMSIVTAITCTHSYNHNAELNPVTSVISLYTPWISSNAQGLVFTVSFFGTQKWTTIFDCY